MFIDTTSFDVIVIGGGHAGVEAGLASSRMGARVLLLTQNIETIGQMSCNPAIGGIGKGHLVREIDALDGVMAKAADRACIHMKTLNSSKGSAVHATRMQSDRWLYREAVRGFLDLADNLFIMQQEVVDIILDAGIVQGVITEAGLSFFAPSVILTTGTFLGGRLLTGDKAVSGGRAAEKPSIPLALRLREMGFRVGRMKTGTPARIDRRSLNFDVFEVQAGDECPKSFSFMGSVSDFPQQINCYITHTTERTFDFVLENLKKTAMYGGHIEGKGPRYCPSFEDKVVKFASKKTHQVFIEPEGLRSFEIYPNGFEALRMQLFPDLLMQ